MVTDPLVTGTRLAMVTEQRIGEQRIGDREQLAGDRGSGIGEQLSIAPLGIASEARTVTQCHWYAQHLSRGRGLRNDKLG